MVLTTKFTSVCVEFTTLGLLVGDIDDRIGLDYQETTVTEARQTVVTVVVEP